MEIGSTLRAARLRHGRTLGDISRATNIPVRVLESIENGTMEQVPGGLFVRAYLRAYAGQVGLDPEAIVNAHLEQDAPPSQEEELDALRSRWATRGTSSGSWIATTLLAALLALLVLAAIFSRVSDEPLHDPPAEPVPADDVPAPSNPVIARLEDERETGARAPEFQLLAREDQQLDILHRSEDADVPADAHIAAEHAGDPAAEVVPERVAA
jgi:cytoskeleton protein RodZ